MNNIQIAALLALTPLVTLKLEAAQQSASLAQAAESHIEMLFAQKLFETGCTHERSASTTTQEQSVAFLYMQEAAKRRHAGAQYALGIFYKENIGLPTNLTEKQRLAEALKYFNLAAEQNLPAAQNALGVCYENGIGIETSNPEKALEWYKKAAAQKDQNAQAGIKRCIEKLQKMLFEIQAPIFPQPRAPQADQASSSSSSSSLSSSSTSSAQQRKTIQTLLVKRQEDAMDIENRKTPPQKSQQTAAIATLAASAGSIPSASNTATNKDDPWIVHEIAQELYKALGNNKKMTADLLGLKQATLDCCLQGEEDLIGEGTAAKVIVEFDIARNEKLLATAWRLKGPVIKRLCELVDDARATTPPNSPSSNTHTTQHS